MNYSIASIRSISCLLVLITHISAVFYIDAFEFWHVSLGYLNQLSRFGTPMFCVITGFLFAKYFYGHLNHQAFYRSRIEKICIPYLVWSMVYIVIMYFIYPNLFNRFIQFPISNLLTGKVFYHLYFISVICQFCLMFPILCLFKKINIIILLCFALCINFISLQLLHHDLKWSFLADRAFLGNWIFYFIFGIFFYQLPKFHLKNFVRIFIPFCILLAISLEFYFSSALFDSTRPANLIYIPALFLFLYQFFNKFQSSILLTIGHYSMGIYLIHPLIIMFIKHWIPSQLLHHFPILSFIALYIATLTICLILCHYISKSSLSKYVITTPQQHKP